MGYLKGVDLQHEPVLGPEIAPATASAIWAQNRQGLQINPLQIPQVTDKAALKQLHTGTFKLHPISIFLYMSATLPVLGPKIARVKQFKGPKHERSNLGAQNTSEAI